MEGATGHVLVSCMKNEGPYVLEFVAHHRVLGFDGIYIASNACNDGTGQVLRALSQNGIIGHLGHSVPPGEGAQHLGYARLRERFGLDRADWLMALDVDEFLYVAPGAGRVQDLTAVADSDVDVIALSSLTFGTVPEPEWRRQRTCRRFTLRLPPGARENAPVKSLTRGPHRFGAINNHSMIGFRGDGPVRVLRGNETVFDLDPDVPIWRQLRNFRPPDIGHALGHYNHYAIRSRLEFQMRQQRGLGVDTSRVREAEKSRHSAEYFDTRATRATIPDRRILTRYGAEVEAEMARLLTLPGVADAHAAAEETMRRAMRRLMAQAPAAG